MNGRKELNVIAAARDSGHPPETISTKEKTYGRP